MRMLFLLWEQNAKASYGFHDSLKYANVPNMRQAVIQTEWNVAIFLE